MKGKLEYVNDCIRPIVDISLITNPVIVIGLNLSLTLIYADYKV